MLVLRCIGDGLFGGSMAGFENTVEAVIDVTRPAFEGIEEYTTKEVGEVGEAVARAFLCDHGYEIVDCNWKTPFGEVDIIAEVGGETVFVEVKSRRLLGFSLDDDCFNAPEQAFDEEKFGRYEKMAEFYKMVHEDVCDIRFDVVAVTFLSNRIAHVVHLGGGYWWDE